MRSCGQPTSRSAPTVTCISMTGAGTGASTPKASSTRSREQDPPATPVTWGQRCSLHLATAPTRPRPMRSAMSSSAIRVTSASGRSTRTGSSRRTPAMARAGTRATADLPSTAGIGAPNALAVDIDGTLYFADDCGAKGRHQGLHHRRSPAPASSAPRATADRPPSQAVLVEAWPQAIAVRDGVLYIADVSSNASAWSCRSRIAGGRQLLAVGPSPTPVTKESTDVPSIEPTTGQVLLTSLADAMGGEVLTRQEAASRLAEQDDHLVIVLDAHQALRLLEPLLRELLTPRLPTTPILDTAQRQLVDGRPSRRPHQA